VSEAPVAADAGGQDAADPIAAQGLAASRCDAPNAQIRNHPEGGVVFNNAMTSADAEVRLMLKLTLGPEGAVEAAQIDPRRTSIDHAVTSSCVAQVAAAAKYPKSPRGTPTVVEYPFVVAAPAK
jgi:hypothetical protein